MTGGTSGIGRVAAVAFARDGAKVVVPGRREKEGSETVALLKKAGGEGVFVKTDVTNESDVAALVRRTVETYGPLAAAFNNASAEGVLGPITEATVENYTHVFDANVKGVLLSMKHEIPALLKNGGGAIVNGSSVAGSVGFPGFGVYAASKHAQICNSVICATPPRCGLNLRIAGLSSAVPSENCYREVGGAAFGFSFFGFLISFL